MTHFIHQYAYLFSLVFFILPISLAFDAATGFAVLKKFATLKGLLFIALSIVFWSAYDVFWIGQLGSFPPHRVIATIYGVPLEEMLLFVMGFYNIAAILTWSKRRFT